VAVVKRSSWRWLPSAAWAIAFLAVPLGGGHLRAADNAPGGDDWKYDIVHRKHGLPFAGLVEEQAPAGLVMTCIERRPGRPTIYYRVNLNNTEIERVELLPGEERRLLRERLEAVRKEREVLEGQLKAIEAGRAKPRSTDKLDLRKVPWVGDPQVEALAYESSHFRLVSNAPCEFVELMVNRLELAYAAYARCLPPRARGAVTTILLPQSQADYQAVVRGQGRDLLNPAFYDVAKNLIVCTFDWKHTLDEVDHARSHCARLRSEVNDREEELRKVYRGTIPAELKVSLTEARNKIKEMEARTHAVFDRWKERRFGRLYHEAFHAYLENFVYPSREGEVPRWLNEGLAQIFETAIFEVGELRIGHADKERLDAVRQALARNTLLPLVDLLRSGPRQFQVAHDGQQQVSDRYYLASWALAMYLTFDRKVLGTQTLDEYVKNLKRGTDPLEAFRSLTGEPLAEFESAFLHYLGHLRPDGSVGKAS
jgi:hypothetical protein